MVQKVLGGVGGVHWLGLGCSLIAWTLETINKDRRNHGDFLIILRQIIKCLTRTREVWKRMNNGDGYIEELKDIVDKAFRCAIVCISNVDDSYLKRFLRATTIKDEIVKLKEELSKMDDDLKHLMLGRILDNTTHHELEDDELNYHNNGNMLVGRSQIIESGIQHLKSKSNDMIGVCLHGMGGVGKTTIAMSIFEEFQRLKDENGVSLYRCCREELPLEGKTNNDLINIQKRILEKVCKHRANEISNCMDGRAILEKKLKNIEDAVFLYLDNILDHKDLAQLLPTSSYFPKGSRILVTTRDKMVYNNMKKDLGIKDCDLLKVTPLGRDTARSLLWHEATHGHKHNASDKAGGCDGIVEEVLDLCDGLPLALKVVGNYINVSGEPFQPEVWNEVVEAMKLAKPLHGDHKDELYARIKFSIDNLDQITRQALLDIVMFKKGWKWKTIEHLVGRTSLEALCRRALVQETQVEKRRGKYVKYVGMNDVLYTLCTKLQAKSKDEELRITKQIELDKLDMGCLKNVVGLSDITVDATRLEKMLNVRTLKGVQIKGECQGNCELNCLLVMEISSDGVVPFDISKSTSLKKLSWFQNVGSKALRKENISSGLKELQLQEWQELENVDVLQTLSCLTSLSLRRCPKIEYLPEGISHLTYLCKLDLRECQGLRCLPEEIRSLSCLKTLKLECCDSLKCLPEGIAGLQSLKKLHLSRCTALQCLPNGISCLTNLLDFSLAGCVQLQSLPEGIGRCQKIVELKLAGCERLQAIPDGIANLTALETLKLNGCHSINALPKGISASVSLDLSGCKGLQAPAEEPASLSCSLRSLNLSGCEGPKA